MIYPTVNQIDGQKESSCWIEREWNYSRNLYTELQYKENLLVVTLKKPILLPKIVYDRAGNPIAESL